MPGLVKRTDQATIQNRLRLFCQERGVDESIIEGLMQSDDQLLDFALRKELNLDWLICGDIRGLHRMAGK